MLGSNAQHYLKRRGMMSKFHNKKTIVDGIKFDSEMESHYYIYLKKLKEEGIVLEFELQPKYILQ